MTKEQFKNALQKRLDKRLETESFEDITLGGSQLRFEMAMAIDGYPFVLPEGSNEEDYTALLTNNQYMSGKFDAVIGEVFSKAYDAAS